MSRGRSLVPKHLWAPLASNLPGPSADLELVDDFHPLAKLRVSGPAAIRRLRRLPMVEYVEPASFDLEVVMSGGSGCNQDPPQFPSTTVSPGDALPYTLTNHNVPQAWQLATGSGVKIGVVDTGTSVFQPQLQSQFDDGQSAGRSIEFDYTDASGGGGTPNWNDVCSHGTAIAGLALAPRDGKNIVGVAYGADALTIRAVDRPNAGPGQWLEVRNGIRKAAGGERGVYERAPIVNMAIGWPWGNSDVASTIEFYHDDEEYKTLFIGAAGTGYFDRDDVVFPAIMPEVVAVTGLDNTGLTECSDCFFGPAVEFGAFTRGESTFLNENSTRKIGGSSGATAIISGIAALVMERYPNLDREGVLQKMREASHYYGNRDNEVGYGAVDAAAAVGAIEDVVITGPQSVPTYGTYNYTAYPVGGTGPFTYNWTPSGASGQTAAIFFEGETYGRNESVSVTVTDQGTGAVRTETIHVYVPGCGSGGGGSAKTGSSTGSSSAQAGPSC